MKRKPLDFIPGVQVGKAVRRVTTSNAPPQVEEAPIVAKDAPRHPGLSVQDFNSNAPRVTVSMELKDNDFGTGFGAFVSVSLACREESLDVACTEVTKMVEGMVKHVHARAAAAFDDTPRMPRSR